MIAPETGQKGPPVTADDRSTLDSGVVPAATTTETTVSSDAQLWTVWEAIRAADSGQCDCRDCTALAALTLWQTDGPDTVLGDLLTETERTTLVLTTETPSAPETETTPSAPVLTVDSDGLPYVSAYDAQHSTRWTAETDTGELLSALRTLRQQVGRLTQRADSAERIVSGSLQALAERIAPDGVTVELDDDDDGEVTVTFSGARLDTYDGSLTQHEREYDVTGSWHYLLRFPIVSATDDDDAETLAREALDALLYDQTATVEGWDFRLDDDPSELDAETTESDVRGIGAVVGTLWTVELSGTGSVSRTVLAESDDAACDQLASDCCASDGRVYSLDGGVTVTVTSAPYWEASEL